MNYKIIIRWLISYLIFFNTACKPNNQVHTFIQSEEERIKNKMGTEILRIKLDSVKQLIEAGDIITRTGNDFTSQSLKTLNRKDKTFSHCGIANIENGSLVIYHAIGGEWNPDQKIKRESYEAFTNPQENTIMGVYRFNILKNEKENLLKTAKQFYKSNIQFDMDFDLKTDDKMYCVEFVYKSFLNASANKITFAHSFINDFEFVGVDDIIHHPLSKKIALLSYKIY